MTPEDPKPKFPPLTAHVAAFAASTRIDDIPPEALHLGKKSILDSLATGVSGSVAPVSDVLRRYLGQLGCGEGPSSAIGTDLRLPPRFAALLNGTAMHADDFDDTWQSVPDGPRARYRGRMGVHATGPALASALAAAEADARPGQDALVACLVGIEVACKVFDATDFADIDNALHTTGTCALVGGAAGVANLRRMEEEVIRRVLGIACDATSGLTVQLGTMAKPWHGGRAAECAVLAADLAALGFTAAETVLEDEGGYFQLEGGGYHEAAIHGLGDPWCFVDRGVWLKPYPTGSLGHPALTQLLALIQEHDVGPDDVSRIRVRTRDGTFKTLFHHHPKRALEAKFSLEFCLATVLLERTLGLKHIDDAFVARPDVQDLIGRVEYTPYSEDVARQGNYTLVTSFVEIEMNDGRILEGRIDYGKGSKANPMSDDEVAEKFRLCAEYAGLPGDRADRVIEMVKHLEELADVRELTALLTPGD
jgi:2-methylcitrate dehydratase PrpD